MNKTGSRDVRNKITKIDDSDLSKPTAEKILANQPCQHVWHEDSQNTPYSRTTLEDLWSGIGHGFALTQK